MVKQAVEKHTQWQEYKTSLTMKYSNQIKTMALYPEQLKIYGKKIIYIGNYLNLPMKNIQSKRHLPRFIINKSEIF